MRDDNDERTLFDCWQESLDEMWKNALDEDSEEDECRTFSCGFGQENEEAPVKISNIDDRLDKVLEKVDDGNSLGAIFDEMFLGFIPVEYEDEIRNPSPTPTDSARPSLASKLANIENSSSQKKKQREKELSLHFAPSLSLRKSNFRRNSSSLRSNSCLLQSNSDSFSDSFSDIEDSDEEEVGTFSCGSGLENEEASVKKSNIDNHSDRALEKVDDTNSLGAIFDKMLLGFTPVEDETRNPSPPHSARHSLARKLAIIKNSSSDRLDRALEKVDDGNSLGAIFDKILLGFTPVEDETRNPSPTHSARHSFARKLAIIKNSLSPKKKQSKTYCEELQLWMLVTLQSLIESGTYQSCCAGKQREKEGSLHLVPSLSLRTSSFRRNSGSFWRNSRSPQSNSDSFSDSVVAALTEPWKS